MLRVLQENEIRRVGGTKQIPVTARVLAATNIDLIEAVEAGRFRRDLYERLKSLHIQLPALRERREDLLALAKHFLAKENNASSRKVTDINPEVLSLFDAYSWPGNIRELEGIIGRAVLLAEEGEILPDHLPEDVRMPQVHTRIAISLTDFLYKHFSINPNERGDNMFGDLLSSRWFQGGLAFFVLVVGGSLLYSWHTLRTTESDMERHDRLLGQQKQKETRTAEEVNVPTATESPGLVNTPDENTDTQMPDTTEALPNETEFADIADAFLPDDAVSADALDPSKMSRFGLGPYPEIPKEWNFIPNYWETCDTIEDELLTRVSIKMHNEGIRSKYGSVGINPSTLMITALERGTVLVEYEIDENGDKRIWRTLAHPDDLEQGTYTRFSEIPSHLKIVTPDEIAFDPYEYLGLPK